jgi:hypothetical protein
MYRMGDEPKNDTPLVFHYSREHRMRRASEAVRKLNADIAWKRPNLFQSLTATKPLALLFLGIIMLGLTATFTVYLLPKDHTAVLEGNSLSVSAFKFQGSTYLSIKKNAGSGARYAGPVGVAVTPWLIKKDGTGMVPPAGSASGTSAGLPVSAHKIVFSQDREEDFRLAVPFEAPGLIVLVQIGQTRVTMKSKVE